MSATSPYLNAPPRSLAEVLRERARREAERQPPATPAEGRAA